MNARNIAGDQWAIFDLDGCLCQISPARIELALKARETGDWTEYHDASFKELPNQAEAMLFKAWRSSSQPIAVITARPIEFESATYWWMKRHGLSPDEVYFRPTGDKRSSLEIKHDILKTYFKGRDVVVIFEDNPRTIRILRGLGYRVFCTQEEAR